ncbi:MAG TPA: ABC transporter substrate-binding protein [Gaiellaceae bacterium]|nr:ABC transporter substrate-binding protein [Gaiellaceae bacterium]
MAASADSRIGKELAGYRVEALMGRGGMGVVYRAHDLALDRDVALKLLAPHLADDVSFRERFLKESRVAASLEHPNVVPIHDAGEIDGQLYIVMRLVEGSDLKAVLREGPLEPARAVRVLEQVAGALDAAHARGLVHRDVKPSNVLLDEREHAYLADFGLSRYLGDAALPLGPAKSLGTADYVAPEQIRGEEVDGRADVYALGCLLYECLAGVPPFRRGTDAATLYAQLEDAPPSLPGLEEVLPRALAKEPAERYSTCGELIEDARQALGIAEPKRGRWPFAVAAVGLALIGAALLAFFLTSRGGGTRPEPGADSLVRIDPRTNKVVGTMAVGRLAGSVAADSRYVWVTSTGDGTVWRIDAKSGSVLKLAAHGTPTAVALDGAKAILADAPEHRIVSLDAATGTVGFFAPLPGPGGYSPLPVAAGPDSVWLADSLSGGSTGLVEKIDDTLASGSSSAQIAISGDEKTLASSYFYFDGLAAGDGALWLAGEARKRVVWRLDPKTHRVAALIHLPFIPKAISAGGGAVWVTSLLDDTVSRIDPRTNRVVKTIPVGRGPNSIAAGNDAVWVTSAIDDALWRVDPRTNRVVARIPLGRVPRAVAVGAGGVWVTTAKPAPPAPTDAIKIGVYADCQGAYGSSYNDSLAGAELPLVERGGRLGVEPSDGVSGVSVGGRPIRLYFGCDPTDGASSTAQTLAEARRLVEQVGVDILIAPTNTPDELALQQYARRHPHTTFVDGAGAAPDPNPARNFFKFNTNGAQWMAGLGSYAYHQLGWRRAVTVSFAPDVFSWAQAAAFDAEFCSLGGTIKRVWYPATLTDYSTIVAQVPSHGVDGVVLDSSSLLLALAKTDPQLRGNLSRKVVFTSIGPGTSLYPLGARAAGIVAAGPTLLLPGADARPGLARGARYRTAFTHAFPTIAKSLSGFFDVPYYDAMAATLQALDRVHGDLSGDERRFMAALAKVTLDAPNGRISLDSKHLGIGPNYVWQLQGPKLKAVVIRTIPRVDASFGGYFKATDPPPSETTPACVKRTPPPWAR